MRVGLHLPQWGGDANRAGVLAVARAAETAGFDSVWVADHLTHPMRTETTYPYGSGGVPWGPDDGFLEAFSTLAVVAGATERIGLGTSVMVMPMRHPLEVAKTMATIDVLSGGRLIVGAGAGWWEEEYRTLEQQFARRGDRFDDQLRIIKTLWRTGRVAHEGEFYEFAEVASEPAPTRPGGPPILIGGMGARAIRRAGGLGDGWHAIGADADVLAAGHAQARRAAVEAGRDPATIGLSTSVGLPSDSQKAGDRLIGLAEAGVGHAVVNVHDQTRAGLEGAIERVATEVLPRVRENTQAVVDAT